MSLSGPEIADPKPPAPLPVEDDAMARAAKQKTAAKNAASSGYESTILTGRLGDGGTDAVRGSDTNTSASLGS